MKTSKRPDVPVLAKPGASLTVIFSRDLVGANLEEHARIGASRSTRQSLMASATGDVDFLWREVQVLTAPLGPDRPATSTELPPTFMRRFKRRAIIIHGAPACPLLRLTGKPEGSLQES